MLEQYTRLKIFVNRLKRRLLSQIHLARTIAILGLILIFILLLVPFLKLSSLWRTYSSEHLVSTANRTNILLLGVGGPGHDAPELTDTIMLLSYHHPSGQISLLSIPRDLWLPSLKTKINSAYLVGNSKQAGGGLLLAKSAVSEVTGFPVHYVLVANFSTFKSAIDLIGGIDIVVPRSFEDKMFPVSGRENDECNGDPTYACRYTTVSFTEGLTHMDGATALSYIRSRHSINVEDGTDFARNMRQKDVLTASVSKLKSPALLKHPGVYLQLSKLIQANIETDINQGYYVSLIKLAWKARDSSVQNYSLTEPDHLYHPPISEKYNNQWVLLPKNDDPTSITTFVSTIFN